MILTVHTVPHIEVGTIAQLFFLYSIFYGVQFVLGRHSLVPSGSALILFFFFSFLFVLLCL